MLPQTGTVTKLTKRVVDGAKPDTRDYFVWDDELPNFGLRVYPTGRKSFVIQYRTGRRTRRYAIGHFGELTPEQARQEAKALLGGIVRGSNPAEERKTERSAITVAELCDDYMRDAQAGLILGKRNQPKKASTIETDVTRVERHIKPLLGRYRVKDLTKADIYNFMRDLQRGSTRADIKTKRRGRAIVRGGAGAASRTVGFLGGILTYAVTRGVIAVNPVHGVKRPASKKRGLYLTPEQYKALGEALNELEAEGENRLALTAIRLLALTGCRRGEIEKLQWSEVDERGKCFRLKDTKEGLSIRPIGARVFEIIEAQPRISEYVLATASGKPFMNLAKAWLRIARRCAFVSRLSTGKGRETREVLAVRIHDLRHSFASHADGLGITEPTIAAMLGHSSGSITRRYIHTVDSALISAADRVSRAIEGMMDGKGEVVTLPGYGRDTA